MLLCEYGKLAKHKPPASYFSRYSRLQVSAVSWLAYLDHDILDKDRMLELTSASIIHVYVYVHL